MQAGTGNDSFEYVIEHSLPIDMKGADRTDMSRSVRHGSILNVQHFTVQIKGEFSSRFLGKDKLIPNPRSE